mgnify:CR=1 FL=1
MILTFMNAIYAIAYMEAWKIQVVYQKRTIKF